MQAASPRWRGRNTGSERAASFLPSASPGKISTRRRFGDEHGRFDSCCSNSARLHNGAPERVLDDEEVGLRVVQQRQVLAGSQLVVERHQHAAAAKHGIGGDQPLGLIGHDNRGAITGGKAGFLQRRGQRQRGFGELPVGEPRALALAIGFDQADLVRPAFDRRGQRRAQGFVFSEIEHNSTCAQLAAKGRSAAGPN